MAKIGSSAYVIFVSFGTPRHKESESVKFRDLYAKRALPWKKVHHHRLMVMANVNYAHAQVDNDNSPLVAQWS